MKVVGKIDSPVTERCGKCKQFFKRGDTVVLNAMYKDVLGWTARTVKHEECPK